MVEKQSINGREVWIQVDSHPMNRENPNIIPTEYFTATCYLQEPSHNGNNGEPVQDEDGATRLFESPVAALSYARRRLETKVQAD